MDKKSTGKPLLPETMNDENPGYRAFFTDTKGNITGLHPNQKKMKPKLLLRIAAALILIHLAGHSLGHSSWDKPEDPKMHEVVDAMKLYKADFMGATKSMADYYNGYSLMIIGLFAMTIIILWFTSGFVNDQMAIARKILYPIGIAYLFFGALEFIYFFPFAASMSFFAGLLTLFSVTFLKRT